MGTLSLDTRNRIPLAGECALKSMRLIRAESGSLRRTDGGEVRLARLMYVRAVRSDSQTRHFLRELRLRQEEHGPQGPGIKVSQAAPNTG